MAAHVLRHAADLAGEVALSIVAPDGSQDWTYAQLESAVRGCSTGLLNLGLAAGDRVILRLGNTADFPITYLACIAVDLIPVPLSAQLTAPEVAKSAIVAAAANPSIARRLRTGAIDSKPPIIGRPARHCANERRWVLIIANPTA